MTKTQVEVITSVERRRRWSRADKERIVAAAIEPGAVASEVARAAGIDTSQLFRWRRQLCGPAQSPAVFSPVAIAAGPEAVLTAAAPGTGSAIEVELATGGRMRITGPVDRSAVSALIKTLTRTKHPQHTPAAFDAKPYVACIAFRRGTKIKSFVRAA